jgi:hypothetical protein
VREEVAQLLQAEAPLWKAECEAAYVVALIAQQAEASVATY